MMPTFTIDELVNKIDTYRTQIDKSNLSINTLLRVVPNFRLDWGVSDNEVLDVYNIGVTKPIILSRLSKPEDKLFREDLLFENNKIAQKLINTFVKNKNLTKELLLEIHSYVIPNGGKWRNQDVVVSDQTYATETFFSNSDDIDYRVTELISWYNTEVQSTELHPLLLSTIFHYNLVKIHPFLDGNGRLARILTSLILLSYRLPPPNIKADDRPSYIFCLRKGDLNDLTPLTLFIGERVLLSLEYIISKQFEK